MDDLGPAVVPGVERVVVLRANALGDFIVTLPALEAVRAAYPAAEIVLLGRPLHAALLAGRPGPVDRVDVVPEDEPGREALLGRLRAERFDLALQLHGGGAWSNPFVRRLRARLAVGSQADDAEPLDRTVPYVHYQHEVHRWLEVAALAGAGPTTTQPRLAVTAADRDAAAVLLPATPAPVAIVHPGSSDPRRRWPAERFAQVADALAERGAQVAVIGSEDERALAARVAHAASHELTVLAGRTSLSALVGLLARAALVLANDSGPRHLAEAVGTPTVAVYWCGNLVNAGPLTRAAHRVHVAWRIGCPVCGSRSMERDHARRTGEPACAHRASYVDEVPVGEVLASALDLLGAADPLRATGWRAAG